jgi:hypothetical protein
VTEYKRAPPGGLPACAKPSAGTNVPKNNNMKISRFIKKNGNFCLYLIQPIGGKSQKPWGHQAQHPREYACAQNCPQGLTLQKRILTDNIPALLWLN